jgi:histone-lysine N-methyltransferase SETDB1
MPEGAFICIYAGEILTDQCATADGVEYGDEYLAELDFIEIIEGVKAEYESDVTDIEEETNVDGSGGEILPPGKKPRIEKLLDQSEIANDSTSASASAGKTRTFATRRTDGQKSNLDHVFSTDEESITARARLPSYFHPKLKEKQKRRIQLRSLYSPEELCYIMDAKTKGNIGRYLNHSCRPNVFVQNVFVNTHDLRFPMVAFFTNSFVRAGTELTWDYHYKIGSVPEKTMYCFCMTPYCRGRLL